MFDFNPVPMAIETAAFGYPSLALAWRWCSGQQSAFLQMTRPHRLHVKM
jgi:hypothetical protein